MVGELIRLRNKINQIDNKLIKLLKERFQVVRRIGKYKLKRGLPIEDKKREQEILDNKCKKSILSKDFSKKLFRLIFDESKKLQRTLK